MKVLHINLSDHVRTGGTGIAMHRLHEALTAANINSKVICLIKELESPHSIAFKRSLLDKIIDKFVQILTSFWGIELNVHRVSAAFSIKRERVYSEADILHLNCIHGGYFSYPTLPVIAQNKPVVYTMHDMWVFTGHCCYSYDCDRWKIGCGKCPYPEIFPAIRKDNTHLEWNLKNWILHHSNVSIVCPSRWLEGIARQSMAKDLPIYYIPYGLDTNIFKPLDKHQCRTQLGIPLHKKVLMFLAASLADKRKGGDLLIEALRLLPENLKRETVLLVVGKDWKLSSQDIGMDTINLGFITSDPAKAVAYSASDLFVLPTRADNLPLVLQESMACGTPMISFKVGGIPDLVRPGITGYLAEPEDALSLRDGIVYLLESNDLRQQMSQQCREIAVKEYSLELYRQRYLDVYRNSIQGLAKNKVVMKSRG